MKEGLTANSTYPKGGVSFSKDSFADKQTLVFQIKLCGKSPALRVAAKRYASPMAAQQLQTFGILMSFTIKGNKN
jgi:hypothetical protein